MKDLEPPRYDPLAPSDQSLRCGLLHDPGGDHDPVSKTNGAVRFLKGQKNLEPRGLLYDPGADHDEMLRSRDSR